MTIILPWPNSKLSPNARVHWAAKSSIAKKYRHTAAILTKQSGIDVSGFENVHLIITFVPPDKRKRDDDNLVAAFKSARDGIADALGVDDSKFITHPSLARDRTVKGGRVEVRFSSVYN